MTCSRGRILAGSRREKWRGVTATVDKKGWGSLIVPYKSFVGVAMCALFSDPESEQHVLSPTHAHCRELGLTFRTLRTEKRR